MSVAPRQSSPRRLVVIAASASLVALAVGAGVVQVRSADAWHRMVTHGAELRERWQARDAIADRAPLWGEAVDGRAFVHYARAAEAMSALRERDREPGLARLMQTPDAELAAALAGDGATLRATWLPALSDLRRGAEARDARSLEDGFADMPCANLLDYRALCNAATIEARAHRQRGEHADAVRLTLDAATLGSDLLADGALIDQMIGGALVAIVVEAWPDDAIRALPEEPRRALTHGLAELDRRLPVQLDMTRELMFMAENLQRVPDQSSWCGDGTWNYGFSHRWMLADAFHMCVDGYRELDDLPPDDWQLRQREFDVFAQRAIATGNRACAMAIPNIISAERTLREVAARVRLLRCAVALHAGDRDVSLPDPFAATPLTARPLADGSFELRSAGNDPDRDGLRRVVRP